MEPHRSAPGQAVPSAQAFVSGLDPMGFLPETKNAVTVKVKGYPALTVHQADVAINVLVWTAFVTRKYIEPDVPKVKDRFDSTDFTITGWDADNRILDVELT